jgi:signal transduction histidine kinase
LTIIDTALMYTNSSVALEVSPNNVCVLITVPDDGRGVGDDARARAFDAFYKAPGSGSGFGLGLAIAKRISDASSADVTLEDDPRGGTLARVRWPAR